MLNVNALTQYLVLQIFWGGKGPNDTGLNRKHVIEGTKARLHSLLLLLLLPPPPPLLLLLQTSNAHKPCVQAAVKRLRLEYVDLVFCHRPDYETPIEETVRAMNHVIDQVPASCLYSGWTCARRKAAIAMSAMKLVTLAVHPEWRCSAVSQGGCATRASSSCPCACLSWGFCKPADPADVQGLAFYWGTSEWTEAQIREAISVALRLGLQPPVMEQPEYNLFNRQKVTPPAAQIRL